MEEKFILMEVIMKDNLKKVQVFSRVESIGDVLANLLATVGAVVDNVVAVGAAERNAAGEVAT